MADSELSDTVKVLNLRKVLSKTVTEESRSKPFLISIGERADAVAEAYENRQMTTQEALAEFERFAEECNQATIETERLNLDDNAYAIYKVLQEVYETPSPRKRRRSVNEVFDQFPDYEWNFQQTLQLRTQLYKRLRLIVHEKDLIEIVNKLMTAKRT